jgi:hypothetical protein
MAGNQRRKCCAEAESRKDQIGESRRYVPGRGPNRCCRWGDAPVHEGEQAIRMGRCSRCGNNEASHCDIRRKYCSSNHEVGHDRCVKCNYGCANNVGRQHSANNNHGEFGRRRCRRSRHSPSEPSHTGHSTSDHGGNHNQGDDNNQSYARYGGRNHDKGDHNHQSPTRYCCANDSGDHNRPTDHGSHHHQGHDNYPTCPTGHSAPRLIR